MQEANVELIGRHILMLVCVQLLLLFFMFVVVVVVDGCSITSIFEVVVHFMV